MKKFVIAAMTVMSLTVAACSHKPDSTVTQTNTTQVLDNGAVVSNNVTTVDNSQ